MNKLTNVVLLIAAAVVSMAAQWGFRTQFVEDLPVAGRLDGKIISVDPMPAADGRDHPLRRALVKLTSGETVGATVPGGCVVFAGQMTRLTRQGGTYFVSENGR